MKKYSKVIVLLIILLNVAFTSAVLWTYFHKGTEPVVLIGAFFGFTTGELFLIAGIKKKEIKSESEKEIKNERDEEK